MSPDHRIFCSLRRSSPRRRRRPKPTGQGPCLDTSITCASQVGAVRNRLTNGQRETLPCQQNARLGSMRSMTINLENVGIAVREIDATIAFFTDLGLELVGRKTSSSLAGV